MSRQLLIYDQVTPVNKVRHKTWSIKASGYGFARAINSAPLTAIEFPSAAAEFPVVFTETAGSVIPVVVMGIRPAENLYVSEDGQWNGQYVPAFVRRYPFVFSSSDDGETLTLCIDESYEGCNKAGRGEALFDADGEQTQYLQGTLNFLKDFQAQHERTVKLCEKLRELDLFEPVSLDYRTPEGETGKVAGFLAVNREKLRALPQETLATMASTDELELVYIHLQSLRNFNRLVSKAGVVHQAQADSEAEPA
jgi:hypothetical protein